VAEKLIFDHTVESVLRTLKRPIPPEQIAGLDALGIDLSKPLLPAYPVETYTALIDFVARQRWPELSPEEGTFQVGRAFIETYTEMTLLGRAAKGVLRTIGPHRTIERMSRTYRTANNYTETRLQRLGPASYELWFNYSRQPHYFRGMVQATLEICKVKQLEVTISSRVGDELTLHVSWQP
jgi:uncharacterized protein (TIGR02265 family)